MGMGIRTGWMARDDQAHLEEDAVAVYTHDPWDMCEYPLYIAGECYCRLFIEHRQYRENIEIAGILL